MAATRENAASARRRVPPAPSGGGRPCGGQCDGSNSRLSSRANLRDRLLQAVLIMRSNRQASRQALLRHVAETLMDQFPLPLR
jgi:hypothetical protein